MKTLGDGLKRLLIHAGGFNLAREMVFTTGCYETDAEWSAPLNSTAAEACAESTLAPGGRRHKILTKSTTPRDSSMLSPLERR